MVILKFNNINTYVSGPPDEIAVVADSMSYAVKGAYFSPAYRDGLWDGRKSFYHLKYDYFPTGLLAVAIEGLKKKGMSWRFLDARPEFEEITEYQDLNLTVTLEDFQKEGLEAFLRHKRCICQMPTRSGKTVLAIACTQKLNLNTLFICPSIDLVKQSRDEFKSKGNIDVGIISEGEFSPQKITVGLIHSIDALLKTKNETLARAVRIYLESIEFTIIDECHVISNRYKRVGKLLKRSRYRLGISATPDTSKEKKLNAMSLCGAIAYKVKMEKLVKSKKIAKPIIYFVNCQIQNYGWSSWDEEYTEGIVENEERNLMISLIAKKYFDKKKISSLLLVEKIRQGEILLDMLRRHMVCEFVYGEHEGHVRRIARWDFEAGKINALIASRVFNQGINIPMLEFTINCSGYKSPIQSIQKWNRGGTATDTKEFTTIVDFYDKGSKNLTKHAEERIRLAEKESAYEVRFVEYEDLNTKRWPI